MNTFTLQKYISTTQKINLTIHTCAKQIYEISMNKEIDKKTGRRVQLGVIGSLISVKK